MDISFTAKNVELTDGLESFITSKLSKFSKFSSRGLSRIQVILHIEKRTKGDVQDAIVELIGDVKGQPITVREQASTFYKAFFGAIAKFKTRMSKQALAP